MIIKNLIFKLMAIGLTGVPVLCHANVRGLTPSDGAINLLLSAVAILIGIGAIIGAMQNFQRTGDGEHSVGNGLMIMLIGTIVSGCLAWIIIN